MTVRRFLLCYLGAVTLVGAAGATGYHALVRRHAEIAAAMPRPALVADASPDAAARDVAPPATTAAIIPAAQPAFAIPKLRPHVTTALRLPRPRSPVFASHAASHAATTVAHDRLVAAYPTQPYNGPPSAGYYAYPAYYPYPGYYGYYARYRYYRAY